MNLSILPTEVIVNICQRLNQMDIRSLMLVNTRLNSIIRTKKYRLLKTTFKQITIKEVQRPYVSVIAVSKVGEKEKEQIEYFPAETFQNDMKSFLLSDQLGAIEVLNVDVSGGKEEFDFLGMCTQFNINLTIRKLHSYIPRNGTVLSIDFLTDEHLDRVQVNSGKISYSGCHTNFTLQKIIEIIKDIYNKTGPFHYDFGIISRPHQEVALMNRLSQNDGFGFKLEHKDILVKFEIILLNNIE